MESVLNGFIFNNDGGKEWTCGGSVTFDTVEGKSSTFRFVTTRCDAGFRKDDSMGGITITGSGAATLR